MTTIDKTTYRIHLQAIYKVCYALATTKDINKLLELILNTAMEITNSDGGTIYQYDKRQKVLKFLIFSNQSLAIHKGGDSGVEIKYPPLPLFNDDGSKNLANIATYCGIQKKLVNIPDAYNAKGFDFSGTKIFDEKNNYHSQSILAVPLIDLEGGLLGVLQLINKTDENDKCIAFDEEDELVVSALSAQSSVAIVRMQ